MLEDGVYEALCKGLVFRRVDPETGYTLYSYSKSAPWTPGAFDNPFVRKARGLIVDSDGNVVARPWPKFFNYGQEGVDQIDPDLPVEVTDKADGCFPRGTKLNLWDGGTIKIDDVVKNKLTPTLVGMDKDGNLVPTKVTDWHDNGLKEGWMRVKVSNRVSRLSGDGAFGNNLYVTPNHRVYAKGEYIPAGDLKAGDKLTSYEPDYDNLDIFLGGLLGDGSVCRNGRNYNYQECHGESQRQYTYDLRDAINGGVISTKDTRGGYSNTPKVWVQTTTTSAFTRLREEWYPEGEKMVPEDLSFMNDVVVAKWFMDDGSRNHNPAQNDRAAFYTNGFIEDDVRRLAHKLEKMYGVVTTVVFERGWFIRVNYAKGTINAFWEAMSKRVFPSMDYKLPPEYRGKFEGFPKTNLIQVPVESEVLEVEYDISWHGNNYGKSSARAYDISTDTENYMCKGVLVHNSLGILYLEPDGTPRIATRGSFESEQAHKATEWLQEVASYLHLDQLNEWTFLFEIIYPENRIVLDYGDFEGLVLLGAVHISSGTCIGPDSAKEILGWFGRTTEVFVYKTLKEALEAPPRPNAEGMVVRQGNKMVKIKQEDYIRLHRIVTGLNKKTVWQAMVDDTFDQMLSDLPDEFHLWALEQKLDLDLDVERRLEEVEYAYEDILEVLDTPVTRGQFAQHAKNEGPLVPFLFAMYDDRDVEKMLLKSLKPKLGEMNAED